MALSGCQENYPDEFCSKYPPEGIPVKWVKNVDKCLAVSGQRVIPVFIELFNFTIGVLDLEPKFYLNLQATVCWGQWDQMKHYKWSNDQR